MKFLSLFSKTPQHQRFVYKPRFYDEQKEEMLERENRIKKEIEHERGIVSETDGAYRSRIAGSFQAARKRSKPSSNTNATLIRLGILLYLTVLIIAFLQWGKPALYSIFVFIPVFIYFKLKK
jgi:hypothetical protein